jgi:hypothetical protein
MGKFKKPLSHLNGMNPYDLYISQNTELRDFLMGYFEYIDAIRDESLKKHIIDIKERGNATQIIQAVSLLGALKLYSIT